MYSTDGLKQFFFAKSPFLLFSSDSGALIDWLVEVARGDNIFEGCVLNVS